LHLIKLKIEHLLTTISLKLEHHKNTTRALKRLLTTSPRHQDFLVSWAVPMTIRAQVVICVHIQHAQIFKDGGVSHLTI